MAKPIRALVINSSGDKIELSKMDSDQQESEEKDSQEDSEEDSEEEEEKFNETFDLKSPQTVFTSNDNFNIQFIQDHSCDYKPGIVLPPPELT